MHYRRVSLPSVGTIQLVQVPAQLNVADKTIQPPTFSAELKDDATVPDHQLAYLSAALRQDKDSVRQSLNDLGAALKERIEDEGFLWNGIGTIRRSGKIEMELPALEPLPAERVMRHDAEHMVLRGDQHMTSTEIAGLKEATPGKRRSIFVIIGWIVLVLSLLFIIFILYQGKFRIGASGSKQAPVGSVYLPVGSKSGVKPL